MENDARGRRVRPGSVFAAGCMGMLVYAFAGQMLPSVLGRIADEFQRDFTQRGLLIALFYAAFFASAMTSGILSDRFGERIFILTGYVLMTFGLALAALGRGYLAVQAGMLAVGLSGGFIEALLCVAVARTFPTQRARALNLMQLFYNVGAVCGPAAAAALLAFGFGWRSAFGVVIFLSLGTQAFSLFALPPPPRRAAAKGGAAAPPPMRWGVVAALSAALFFYVAGEMTTSQWSANFLEEALGSSAAISPLVVGGFWLGMGVGRVLYAWFVSRTGCVAPLMASAVLAAGAALFAAWAPNATAAAWACGLLGFFLGGAWPTILGYASHLIEGRTGAVYGIVVACGGIGAAVGPALGGWLADHTAAGPKAVMLSGAGWIVLMGLTVLGIWGCERLRTAKSVQPAA